LNKKDGTAGGPFLLPLVPYTFLSLRGRLRWPKQSHKITSSLRSS